MQMSVLQLWAVSAEVGINGSMWTDLPHTSCFYVADADTQLWAQKDGCEDEDGITTASNQHYFFVSWVKIISTALVWHERHKKEFFFLLSSASQSCSMSLMLCLGRLIF